MIQDQIRPRPLTPGQIVPLGIALGPSSILFRPWGLAAPARRRPLPRIAQPAYEYLAGGLRVGPARPVYLALGARNGRQAVHPGHSSGVSNAAIPTQRAYLNGDSS